MESNCLVVGPQEVFVSLSRCHEVLQRPVLQAGVCGISAVTLIESKVLVHRGRNGEQGAEDIYGDVGVYLQSDIYWKDARGYFSPQGNTTGARLVPQ